MAERSPRAVVITGASQGIGEATALHLDHLGYHVFAGVRSEQDAAALGDKASQRLTALLLDVTEPASLAAAADAVRAVAPDGLAGLVNNAGIVVAGPLEFLPLEQFRLQLEVNVVGVLATTQALLPLIRTGHGRIVNVSSVNGRLVTPFAGAYGASKFALEGLSDALRRELRHWRIPVSVVQPGAIRTRIWETSSKRALAIAQGMPARGQELYGRVLKRLSERAGEPPARAIPPERVARTIARALTARRARTRYVVGTDARIGAAMAALLPDRWMDRILTGRSRPPERPSSGRV